MPEIVAQQNENTPENHRVVCVQKYEKFEKHDIKRAVRGFVRSHTRHTSAATAGAPLERYRVTHRLRPGGSFSMLPARRRAGWTANGCRCRCPLAPSTLSSQRNQVTSRACCFSSPFSSMAVRGKASLCGEAKRRRRYRMTPTPQAAAPFTSATLDS